MMSKMGGTYIWTLFGWSTMNLGPCFVLRNKLAMQLPLMGAFKNARHTKWPEQYLGGGYESHGLTGRGRKVAQ